MSHIHTTIGDGIAEIELDRREKKNALDSATYQALAHTLAEVNADATVRVILLRGQKDLFCAGNDLHEFIDPDGPGTKPALALMDVVQALRKPLIAAVGGPAVGLGTTILFHCDAVYATPQARFGMPFVALGVCPEFGTSLLAPLFGGYHRAAQAILFAETFDASAAREMGLVNQVVEADELLDYARRRAARLAGLPHDAVCTAKAMLKKQAFGTMPELFREELRQFDAMLRSADSRQAIAAFLDRRQA